MDAREHGFDDFGIAITIFLDAWFTAVFSITPLLFDVLLSLQVTRENYTCEGVTI